MPELKVRVVSRAGPNPPTAAPWLHTSSSLAVLPYVSDQRADRASEYEPSLHFIDAPNRTEHSGAKRVCSAMLSVEKYRPREAAPSVPELAGAPSPAARGPGRLPPKLLTLLRFTEIINRASAGMPARASERPPRAPPALAAGEDFRRRGTLDV